MDREFMEEYYGLKYPDGLTAKLLETAGQCKGLYDKAMELEGKVEAVLRGQGEECLQLHRTLFVTKGELEELVVRLAYLQGAEDREKMLK